MSTVKKRSPLDRSPPLRAPGQSLNEQLQDEFYDHIFGPGMLAVMMVIMAGLEWFRYVTPAKPNPVIYTVVAVNDGVVLDFDANSALVGIDVQHASKRADVNILPVSKMPLGGLLAA